jgi:hypothetical protein
LSGQLCDLRGASAVCATAAAHPLAHCHADGDTFRFRHADSDVFPFRHANSFGQPNVVANVHADRDPETNLDDATGSCDHDAVCYRYRDASTDSHAFAHSGDTRANRYVHCHIHAHTERHIDTNAHVDACTNIDVDTSTDAIFYCHNGAYADADADRIAQFHAPAHLNSDRATCCHADAVPHRRQLIENPDRACRMS